MERETSLIPTPFSAHPPKLFHLHFERGPFLKDSLCFLWEQIIIIIFIYSFYYYYYYFFHFLFMCYLKNQKKKKKKKKKKKNKKNQHYENMPIQIY